MDCKQQTRTSSFERFIGPYEYDPRIEGFSWRNLISEFNVAFARKDGTWNGVNGNLSDLTVQISVERTPSPDHLPRFNVTATVPGRLEFLAIGAPSKQDGVRWATFQLALRMYIRHPGVVAGLDLGLKSYFLSKVAELARGKANATLSTCSVGPGSPGLGGSGGRSSGIFDGREDGHGRRDDEWYPIRESSNLDREVECAYGHVGMCPPSESVPKTESFGEPSGLATRLHLIEKENEKLVARVKELEQDLKTANAKVQFMTKELNAVIEWVDECKSFITRRITTTISLDGYSQYLQSVRNKILHALYGNCEACFQESTYTPVYDPTYIPLEPYCFDLQCDCDNVKMDFQLYLQLMRNKMMHALNGNGTTRGAAKAKAVKQRLSKKVKTEVKKDVKKAVRNVAKKEVKAVARAVAIKPFQRRVGPPPASRAKPASKKYMRFSKRVVAYTNPNKIRNMFKTARTADDIARAICLPGISKPFRFALGYQTVKTAISNPFQRIDVPWAGTAAYPTGRELASDDMPIFAFRNPFRATVFYDPNVTSAIRNADFMFANQLIGVGTVNPGPAIDHLDNISILPTTTYYLPTCYTIEAGPYFPHGPNLYAASVTGNAGDKGRYMWYDATTTLNIAVTASNAGVSGVLSVDQWSPNGVQSDVFFTSAVTVVSAGVFVAASLNITVSGYYALKWSQVSAQTTWFFKSAVPHAIVSSGGEAFCHRPVKDLFRNLPSTDGIRVNAYAMLYNNTAAESYRSGKFALFQSPGTSYWMDWIGGGIAGVASSEDSAESDIKNGWYEFAKPVDEGDFKLWTCYDINNGSISDIYYPLQDGRSFLVSWSKIDKPSTTAGSPNAQNAVLHVIHALEHGTEDVWRNVSPPSLKRGVFQAGLDKVRFIPQYHENETHIDGIMNSIFGGIERGLGIAEKFAPMVGSIMSLA